MKALVIYDSTGRIWAIVYGEEEIPQGITAMFVDIPDGASLSRIDVTDPANPKAVFDYLPKSDIGRLQEQMKEAQQKIENIQIGYDDTEHLLTVLNTSARYTAATFTDEQALTVPELYAEWSGDEVKYTAGERLRYFGVLYKVLQDHTSQEDWSPDAAPSLFAKVLIEDPNTIPEWEQPDSTNGYGIGDKVTHNGTTWVSLVDDNVWEPGTTGTESVWQEVVE